MNPATHTRYVHIVQVLLSPRIGGAETLVRSLAQEWEARGVRSTTIYLDDEPGTRGRVGRLKALRRGLRELSPDVVLAHSYLPALYARAAWGKRVPVHSVLHSASDDFADARPRIVEQLLRSRTASIVAVAQSQLDIYAGHFGSRVPTAVIPNGISTVFQPADVDRTRTRIITTLARVAVQKRPAFWNQVVNQAGPAFPELRFQWWGPLSGRTDLDEFVQDPQLVNGRFMGPTGDPAGLLQNTDILFHSSEREAHSITLLEAALAGVPVVYADSIDPPDGDPIWRFRYAADDPEDALRVLTLVSDGWAAARAEAVRYASTHRETYGMTRTADRYLAWIRDQK